MQEKNKGVETYRYHTFISHACCTAGLKSKIG
jgi:hypothetical protein